MEPSWILLAFTLGFLAYKCKLPPMLGYLAAGFMLLGLGIEVDDDLEEMAELGVILLLFSIGLKLKISSLFKTEIWGTASGHLVATVLVYGLIFFGLSALNISLFTDLSPAIIFLIAFTLSFSSTVFAIKILEERAESSSHHGRIAIGVLVMQDIFAVAFIALAAGHPPSPWAILLIGGLIALRPILLKLLDNVGHRELLMLFSIFLALGMGAGGFELVNMEADLGALLLGMLVASHPKAKEMSATLMSFKDFFLVGFFLQIGLSGLPTIETFLLAIFLVFLIPIKAVFFFFLLTKLKIRARTSFFTAFNLASYSEFCLLVASLSVRNGWLETSWLTTLALALAISFLAAAPLNRMVLSIYEKHASFLRRFEKPESRPEAKPFDLNGSQTIIFGMGRLGCYCYDEMHRRHQGKVLGVDNDDNIVSEQAKMGRKVVAGDATDKDFWKRFPQDQCEDIKLILLAMPDHNANLQAAEQLAKLPMQAVITATAKYDDEVTELREAGINSAFNFYKSAGNGFAEHADKALAEKQS